MQIQPIFNNFLAIEFLDIDNNALSIYCKEKYKEQQELNPSLGCFLDFSAAETKPLIDAINLASRFPPKSAIHYPTYIFKGTFANISFICVASAF